MNRISASFCAKCSLNGRVRAALEDAGFGKRLKELSNGSKTRFYRDYGESGVQISGGEAQKIAITRALHRGAPFLILDEPTAALDPITEVEIYAGPDRITGDRTAIYISHRLSSCRFCDEIMVFDRGKIVQRGAHETPVNDKDIKYHALWHAQAQYYQENRFDIISDRHFPYIARPLYNKLPFDGSA